MICIKTPLPLQQLNGLPEENVQLPALQPNGDDIYHITHVNLQRCPTTTELCNLAQPVLLH